MHVRHLRGFWSRSSATLSCTAAALGLAPSLASQSRPLVLSRAGHTLVIERVELAVSNAQLLRNGVAVGTPAEAQLVRLDLRRNTAAITVNGAPGRYHRISFDLRPSNGWSVRITGRSDTTRFDLRVPIDRRVVTDLLIPRRIKDDAELDVRIRLQASRWFRDFRSGALLDPKEDRETILARVEASLPALTSDDTGGQRQSEQSPSG